MTTEDLLPCGEKMKKAIRWVSETKELYPERHRIDLVREAEMRFDLSPRECEFLTNNFSCPETGNTK